MNNKLIFTGAGLIGGLIGILIGERIGKRLVIKQLIQCKITPKTNMFDKERKVISYEEARVRHVFNRL